MVAMLPLPLPLRVWAWFRPVWTKDNFEHDTITSLQDRPRDGQQGVGGQLGAEARIWDHQRPLGASVLRQRGDSWGLGEPGGDGRLRVRLRQGVVMPFIESTYFFFIFLLAAILKFE